MDLIRISDNKLKVVLTPEDMRLYALTGETMDYATTETKRAFWDILDTAKHKTGFDAARDRVYIQVFPSRDGGCEMYVTKLHRAISAEKGSDASALPVCRVFRDGQESARILVFSSMEAMLGACRALNGVHSGGSSAAYCVGQHYYLCLTDYDAVTPCAEFGRTANGNLLPYLREHGQEICGNDAVRTLASLA